MALTPSNTHGTGSQSKRTLYDSYIRALRWGADRIEARGILAYVTNGGYIDSNSSDGIRTTLTRDFDHLYVYNLRGNSRTAGDLAKREGGNVFNVRVGAAILIGVKDSAHTGGCVLHYRDIGDYLSKEEKLSTLEGSELVTMDWERITPNRKGEWINQSSDTFDTYPPLGDKGKNPSNEPIFNTYSLGLGTNRDAWVYNYSQQSLQRNVQVTSETYERIRVAYASSSGSKRSETDVAEWIKKYPDSVTQRKFHGPQACDSR